ncbi:GNAT family N-acetyltransferase [Hymenobacter qilianensis]|nr:GNAT family N-acetyltransferase [Hymenobacter qilianensis]
MRQIMHPADLPPFPARLPLLTPRLTLRPYVPSDEAAFFAVLGKDRARLQEAFPARLAAVQTSADAGRILESFDLDWHTKRMFVLGIWRTAGGQYLGDISLKPTWARTVTAEIGYYLASEAEGYGYAREALTAAVQLGFSPIINADRLVIRCRVDNPRSCAVAVANGFQLVPPQPRLWSPRKLEKESDILHFALNRP